MSVVLCGCGAPLHYADVVIERFVQAAVDRFGPTVAVTTDAGTWHVPRHFYALHCPRPEELPQLAELHGWEKDDNPESRESAHDQR